MITIISHTPLYVWPLLAYLVWGGLKARKTHVVPWKALLIMPVVMFLWSIYSIVVHYDPLWICLWAIGMTLGMWLGWLTVRKHDLRFDKQRNLIEIPGNWAPMLLSLSIFSLRYFLGAIYGLHPELIEDANLLSMETLATAVSGMLLGRLIGFWRRSLTSPHIDLA